MIFKDWIETPLGIITLFHNDDFLLSLYFKKVQDSSILKPNSKARNQLAAYFSRSRIDFDFNFDFKTVSPFVGNVLRFLKTVPYGKTLFYSDIAKILNTSPRAIGIAMRKNPLPIFFPCHRVIAKTSLGGYSAGIDIKIKLLEIEGLTFQTIGV